MLHILRHLVKLICVVLEYPQMVLVCNILVQEVFVLNLVVNSMATATAIWRVNRIDSRGLCLTLLSC